jgi:ectoine hydroxylase-related dioxygenase (phytanoyl-CoA dioxygenase family)
MTVHTYQLRTAGYTILPQVFNPSTVRSLRAGLDGLMRDEEAEWGGEHLRKIGQHGALRNLANGGAEFCALLSNPEIIGLVESVVQRELILHSFDGLILYPGEGRFPWDFHTDLMPLRGLAWPANRTPGVNILILVDDLTKENGGTALLPASHHSLLTQPDAKEMGDLSIQVSANAGDVLFFDARVWHCAGENRSQEPRRLIKMLFCESFIRPQMDYARAVDPAVLNSLAPAVRKLLGVGITPPATVSELRSRLAKNSS